MTLRVACSALGKRIFAGHLTKDGTRFREPRHDVTSDVLKAVIDKIEIGNEIEVSDGESIVARIAVLPPVTTPARAEAQDEGAAGERDHRIEDCAWRVRYGDSSAALFFLEEEADDSIAEHGGVKERMILASLNRAHPSPTPSQDEGAAGWIVGNSEDSRWRSWDQGSPVWVDDRAKATRYARREDAEAVHAEDEDAWCVKPYPSPTPAADDDRVRIAVEALEPFAHIASHVGLPKDDTVHVTALDGQWMATVRREDFWNARRALAALKSTAQEAAAHG